MQYRLQILLVAITVFSLQRSSLAEFASISGDLAGVKNIYSKDGGKILSSSKEINLDVQTDSGKHIVLSLDQVKHQDWPAVTEDGYSVQADKSEVTFLNGKAEVDGQEVKAASAIFKSSSGVLALHVNLILPGASPSPAEIEIPLNGEAASFRIADMSILKGKKCGNSLLPGNIAGNFSSEHAPVKAASVKVIDLSLDADYDFYSQFGSETNNRMAAIVNAAQVIYQEQLGLVFNIKRQRAQTSRTQRFTSSDSGELLEDFTDYINSGGLGGADNAHLFTGKDLLDGVLGLAYVGVVCSDPEYSTGLTQHYDTALDYLVFAHEMGHNLGAEHDASTPRTIMYPSAGPDQTYFSATSINQMNAHVSSYGSCLATSNDPAPDPREEEPSIKFSSSFNKKTGEIKFVIARAGVGSGRCIFQLALGSDSNFKKYKLKEARSAATKLTFTAKTTQRLSSSSAKIYAAGAVYDCAGSDEELVSSTKKLAPVADKKTSRKNKVSATSWMGTVIKGMKVK